jgi:hypothetical protein
MKDTMCIFVLFKLLIINHLKVVYCVLLIYNLYNFFFSIDKIEYTYNGKYLIYIMNSICIEIKNL